MGSIWAAMLKIAPISRKKTMTVTRSTTSSSRKQSKPNRRLKLKRTICSETTTRVKGRATMMTTSTMTLRRICQRRSMPMKTQTPMKRAQIRTEQAKESRLVSRLGLTLAQTRWFQTHMTTLSRQSVLPEFRKLRNQVFFMEHELFISPEKIEKQIICLICLKMAGFFQTR